MSRARGRGRGGFRGRGRGGWGGGSFHDEDEAPSRDPRIPPPLFPPTDLPEAKEITDPDDYLLGRARWLQTAMKQSIYYFEATKRPEIDRYSEVYKNPPKKRLAPKSLPAAYYPAELLVLAKTKKATPTNPNALLEVDLDGAFKLHTTKAHVFSSF
eukprot:TRINITY_DN2724_c1_g1_i1.p1 TRINITY_DN2724_c1_g1~~TRINITY_DN2724_c1_g1_i1.p1  ORF type:complete len:156 (-),score=34.13 TRINITY_DN2724_c1_g1_i1:498-965(-)